MNVSITLSGAIASDAFRVTQKQCGDEIPFRGRVLTGGDAPLPGVRLEMGGVETLSDANGDFFLDNIPVSGRARLLVDGNVVDPALGSFATVPEVIDIIEGTENLLEPEIFLLPLDVASADPVDPTQTSIVTSSRFTDGLSISEPVTLTIPPGSAIDDETGQPFVGDIHISRVTDPTKGPRPLPEEFDLSVYIAIQPFGVTYPEPVPISFPNIEKFPPGSRLDFFALDHETGIMEKIGEGLVSPDGKTVDSIGGVVKSNSWHGIVPQGPVASPNNSPNQSEPGYYGGYSGGYGGSGSGGPNPNHDAPNCNNGCLIDEETGNLKEWHHVPTYTSLQQTRGIRLEYNSNLANAQPVIPLLAGFGNRAPPPELMSMRINLDGIDMGQEVFSKIRIEESEVRGQFKTTRPAIQFNASMIDSGIYDYELDIDCYFPISRRLGKVNDVVIIQNERNSHFGAGWTIAGLQRVYPHRSGSVMLTEGTASSLIFDPQTNPDQFISPPGDFSTLTRLADGTLERRMKNGMRFRFDSAGLMVQAIDRNNNVTTYIYDGAERLTSILDPVGQSFNLTYSAGKLASISDPLDRTTSFEHDSEGNLIAIVEPNGDRRTFEYSPGNHLMTAQLDQRQNRTGYMYDFAGRIRETLLPDGSNPKFDIGQTKGLPRLAIKGAPGDGTRENPTEAPPLTDEIQNVYIDHNGNEYSETTDDRHMPLAIKDAVGREYQYERDEDSNPTRRIRPNGSVVDSTYDDRGNTGGIKEAFNQALHQYEYDAFSLVTSYTNPNSHTTTFNRDPANGDLLSIINHLGHTTTYEYDGRGLVQRMVTPNLLEVVYTYNTQGLVETVTETPPSGSPGNVRVTRFSYDAVGQLTRAISPDGITLTMEYDDKGRRTRITDNLNQSVEYLYDAADNLIRTDTRNGDGSLALTLENLFDTRNRFVDSIKPHAGSEESIVARTLDNNSNIIGLTDPNGNGSSSKYDGEDRLIESTHRLDGVTKYGYDTNDRIIKVTAPNGVVTRYTYDVLGRRLTETSADRGSIEYDYDRNNNVTEITDGRGITATLIYDELERVSSKVFPNSIPGKIETVTYTYDNCPFGIGRLCQRVDESGTWSYEYDAFGNVVKETRLELGVTYVTEYEYDEGNNIIEMTYPTGRVVEIERDGLRRIESIKADVNGVRQDIVSDIEYRADNQITQCTFGNGLVDEREYDLQGRLLNQSLGLVDTRSYTYDKNSNMLSRVTTPQTSQYAYDALDRLTGDQIDGADNIEYTYDLNHNRQSKIQAADLDENYVYDSTSNRLLRNNRFSTGTLLPSVRERQYVYSDTNRIYQVIDLDLLRAEYVYNDIGQRTRKTVYDHSSLPVVTTTTLYHYDLAGKLIAETDQLGNAKRDYLWGTDFNPVAQVDVNAESDTIYYLHTDHLMTPRFATDSSKQTTWRWEGEAFGDSENQSLVIEVNLRFPGQYYDAETGEYYNWNRYYRPSLGRYLSSDLMGLAAGDNTYIYSLNNPFFFIDPLGNLGFAGAAVGAVLGAIGGLSGALAAGQGGIALPIAIFAGAVSGALVGAVSPAASLSAGTSAAILTNAAIGAISNTVGQTVAILVNPESNSTDFAPSNVIANGAFGAIGGALGPLGPPIAAVAGNIAFETIKPTIYDSMFAPGIQCPL